MHFAARHFGIFYVNGKTLPFYEQNPLLKELELPLSESVTKILGIHQSDVIIRSALVAAMADLRANPWLLDYVFASLPQDEQTWKDYGEKSVQKAKEWFLRTEIPVRLTPIINEVKTPCISITLLESSEATQEATLGDVHYEPTELSTEPWLTLTPPFTPVSYSTATGLMVLKELPKNVYLSKGQYIVDKAGRPYEILEVIDNLTCQIQAGTVADFRDAILKSSKVGYLTSIESSSYKETYRIGIHCNSEPVYLTWLHSIIVFILLRYKQALLEGRGFERSTFQSSDFARDESTESELIFSRYITLNGFVRQYWPKDRFQAIDSVIVQPLKVNPADKLPTTEDDVNKNEATWVGHNDELDKDGIG